MQYGMRTQLSSNNYLLYELEFSIYRTHLEMGSYFLRSFRQSSVENFSLST